MTHEETYRIGFFHIAHQGKDGFRPKNVKKRQKMSHEYSPNVVFIRFIECAAREYCFETGLTTKTMSHST